MRRSCKSCNAVFHLEFNPPKVAGKCDKCGGELYQRSDDTEQTVRERLRVYKEPTLPLTKYYAEKGILMQCRRARGTSARSTSASSSD